MIKIEEKYDFKSIDKKINSDDKTDVDGLEKNIKSLAKKIQEY